MHYDFWEPRGLLGTHMDTLKPKNSKSIKFTERGGFFTFWAILAHSVALLPLSFPPSGTKVFYFINWPNNELSSIMHTTVFIIFLPILQCGKEKGAVVVHCCDADLETHGPQFRRFDFTR